MPNKKEFNCSTGLLHLIYLWLVISVHPGMGQTNQHPSFAFVSDTQAPMWVEKIALHYNQNEKATGLIFGEILRQKPPALFILGDVVSLGFKKRRWRKMDLYLEQCRKGGIEVNALLGNHDVMRFAKKGEARFQERFPKHVRTGYVRIIDSVAVVMLNSNFKKLSSGDIAVQQAWLKQTLQSFDDDPSVRVTIVTCHHAPYSNSKLVGSTTEVQQNFVPNFILSGKCRLFITGHAHDYEHFNKEGKDFLAIGGGGGLHHPLRASNVDLEEIAAGYNPMFHYLTVTRTKAELRVTSYYLQDDFTGFEEGNSFTIPL